jgi:hypothetical protein|tara:strand:+ start:26 stop:601 length:576 start_codon:yes stop_codon:yes gene_type:complete
MSQDNVLKKEWSKKDVTRARNLIQGKTNTKTTEGIGYSKKEEFHKEGDIWVENGRKWTIKKGIKQNITKYDNFKKAVKTPLFCPSCDKQMKFHMDKTIFKIHKKCYNCLIEFEHSLRTMGVWDVYEKNLHNGELDAFIKDFKLFVDDKLKTTNNSFISEDGDVQKWVGGYNEERVSEGLKKTIEYLENLKK